MKKTLVIMTTVIIFGLFFNACGKKTAAVREDKPETATVQPTPAVAPAPQPVTPTPIPTPTPSLTKDNKADNTDKNQGITVKTSLGDQILQMDAIYFDYDSYELRPDALKILEKSAKILKQNPTAVITIEGHCDERGTVEYNIALGERRAYSVKNYFVEYGLNPENLITISYGKEKPVDPGHDEDAWSKNRRAAIVPNP